MLSIPFFFLITENLGLRQEAGGDATAFLKHVIS
jgi:hypothetical protein